MLKVRGVYVFGYSAQFTSNLLQMFWIQRRAPRVGAKRKADVRSDPVRRIGEVILPKALALHRVGHGPGDFKSFLHGLCKNALIFDAFSEMLLVIGQTFLQRF